MNFPLEPQPSTNVNHNNQSDEEHEQIAPIDDVPLSFGAIPDSEIDKAPRLRLEIIEGPGLGTYYDINAGGLISLQGRGRKDGWVLVGSQEYANNIDEPYNDIVLESVDNSEIGKRHFLIKYNLESSSYYLRDLGDGNGTFVRLDTPLILKTGYIISFGDSHMFIQIAEDPHSQTSKLDIKFLDGPKTDQSYSFSIALHNPYRWIFNPRRIQAAKKYQNRQNERLWHQIYQQGAIQVTVHHRIHQPELGA